MIPFEYRNCTRYVYGNGEYRRTGALLKPLSNRVLLHYGGGSAQRSGLLDEIRRSLSAEGIYYSELGGVKPNPELALVEEGIRRCREESIGLVLAVGGGSVIDSAKAIAAGTRHQGEVWKLYTREEVLEGAPLPVATVLTLPAAGSENSPNTVITNPETGRKLGYKNEELRPAVSIISPELFLTLPRSQMAYGACDMLCHIFERYFTRTEGTELSDALCEATMRTIISQARILSRDLQNEAAWGQLALSGTIAHNNLLGVGREQSWACHALEHELSAAYDVPHGGGLAVIIPAYMEHVAPYAPGMFCQWATNVMGVEPSRNTQEVIREGIRRLRDWYRELGLPATMEELGVPADADFAAMARAACGVHAVGVDLVLAGVHPVRPAAAEAIYRACL